HRSLVGLPCNVAKPNSTSSTAAVQKLSGHPELRTDLFRPKRARFPKSGSSAPTDVPLGRRSELMNHPAFDDRDQTASLPLAKIWTVICHMYLARKVGAPCRLGKRRVSLGKASKQI